MDELGRKYPETHDLKAKKELEKLSWRLGRIGRIKLTEPGFRNSDEKFRIAKKLNVDCHLADRHILTLSPVYTAAQLESLGITS